MPAPSPVNVVFLDRATFPEQTTLRGLARSHIMKAYDRTLPSEVAERIMHAHVVITNKVSLGRDDLSQAPNLKMIAVAATGYDVIDVEACAEKGIAVCNVRDYAKHTVPEHTFALILALRRSLMPYRDSVARGRWQEANQFCYFDHPIRDLAGSVLGIFGAGAIGQAVGKIAHAFGMEVLFAGRRGEPASGKHTPFETVLERADVLTFHLPLRPNTRKMIGPAEFARMKRMPLIINTGRGGLVDEEALVNALLSRQISGAGFDVATTEPVGEDHPFNSVLGRDDFILTPHVAWASLEATQTVADGVFDNIENFLAGSPTNLVST